VEEKPPDKKPNGTPASAGQMSENFDRESDESSVRVLTGIGIPLTRSRDTKIGV